MMKHQNISPKLHFIFCNHLQPVIQALLRVIYIISFNLNTRTVENTQFVI